MRDIRKAIVLNRYKLTILKLKLLLHGRNKLPDCTYLISHLGAQEVFGHMIRKHVSDQRLVVRSHFIHFLLLFVNLNLPQKQFTRLSFHLREKNKHANICQKQSRGNKCEFLSYCWTYVTCIVVETHHHDDNHHSQQISGGNH